MLKAYIDKTFDKYDTDKNGTLDEDELTFFFNDLFRELNIPTTVNKQQSLEAIRSIDQNSDGKVDKKELFDAFKKMLNVSPPPPPQYPPPPNQMYSSYPPPPPQQSYSPYGSNPYQPVYHGNNQYNPYGINNPYMNPPPQYPNYHQYSNQNPYNNYQPPQNYNGYPPYNPNNYMNNSNNYMGGSTGNRWGRKQ